MMKRYGQLWSIVTERLCPYGAAMKVIGNLERQEPGRWLNNRAENSHQPFRRREGAMAGSTEICFRSCPHSQSFQPRPSPLPPRYIQTEPGDRSGRVTPTCGLRFMGYGGCQNNSRLSDSALLADGWGHVRSNRILLRERHAIGDCSYSCLTE